MHAQRFIKCFRAPYFYFLLRMFSRLTVCITFYEQLGSDIISLRISQGFERDGDLHVIFCFTNVGNEKRQ